MARSDERAAERKLDATAEAQRVTALAAQAAETRVRELEALEFEWRSQLKRAESELAQLREQVKKANALIREWSNFDFDCPDEFDPETDEEGEDGAALERLYAKTSAYLEALRGPK